MICFMIANRDAPNMLNIIPSRTSQNLSVLFFKIPPIIPALTIRKIIAILTQCAQKVPYNIEKAQKLIVADESILFNMHL